MVLFSEIRRPGKWALRGALDMLRLRCSWASKVRIQKHLKKDAVDNRVNITERANKSTGHHYVWVWAYACDPGESCFSPENKGKHTQGAEGHWEVRK